MKRYKKLTILHSNDLHGDFFSEEGNEELIGGAVLINRGINFYLFVLISAIIVMIYTIKDKKEQEND